MPVRVIFLITAYTENETHSHIDMGDCLAVMNYEQLVDRFVTGYGSIHTQRAYRQDLEQWRTYCQDKQLDPTTAGRHDVETWARTLERQGKSASTVKRRIGTLASFCEYLMDEGLLERSPAARVRRPRVDQESKTSALSLNQLNRLVETARQAGTLEHALIVMLGGLGLRVGETCKARVEHLGEDEGRRILHLPERKGGKVGVAVLPPSISAAVDAHINGRAAGPLLLHPSQENFGVHRQKPLAYSTAYTIVKKIARNAGLPQIHPHSLRHTFATLALDAGVDMYDLQLAMGHSSSDTTMRYDRARARLQRAPSLAVEEIIRASSNPAA